MLNQKDNKKQKECENKHEMMSVNDEEDDEELETVSYDGFEDMTKKNKIGMKNRKLHRYNKTMIKVKETFKHK